MKTVTLSEEQKLNIINHNVAWLQLWLNEVVGTRLVVDGIWGTKSRTAFLDSFVNKNAAPINDSTLWMIAQELGDSSTKRIKAVASVESAGSGWDKQGRVRILYERHKFYQYHNPKILTAYSNPTAGGYTNDANSNGINDSWEKLAAAVGVDPLAALKSISIGKFQVMGSWFKECGYDHPIEMLWKATHKERYHYEMLRDYILKIAKIKKEYQAMTTNPETCRAFAKAYNGSGYAKNNYHVKLANALK